MLLNKSVRFQSVMTKTAALVREDPRLSSFYQFGWLDGNELVNNIILGTMHQPGIPNFFNIFLLLFLPINIILFWFFFFIL